MLIVNKVYKPETPEPITRTEIVEKITTRVDTVYIHTEDVQVDTVFINDEHYEIVNTMKTITDTLGNSVDLEIEYNERTNAFKIASNFNFLSRTIYEDRVIYKNAENVPFCSLYGISMNKYNTGYTFGVGYGVRVKGKLDLMLNVSLMDLGKNDTHVGIGVSFVYKM